MWKYGNAYHIICQWYCFDELIYDYEWQIVWKEKTETHGKYAS